MASVVGVPTRPMRVKTRSWSQAPHIADHERRVIVIVVGHALDFTPMNAALTVDVPEIGIHAGDDAETQVGCVARERHGSADQYSVRGDILFCCLS